MISFARRIPVFYLYFFSIVICLCLAVSCKKIDDNNNVTFRFSYPYISFDTVFTSIGSITRQFTVYNPSKSDVKTTIYLAGGNNSSYSINVNGNPGTYFKDVAIRGKDSIFVFVKVNINPKNQNNPFLVTDSIVFMTGSRVQALKLYACGQDANYIIADQGPENLRYKVVAGEHQTVTWTKERPYVVYGWAVVDSTGTLIIEPGTKVYFHSNSGLWAYKFSNLEVNGTYSEPVLFRGDRLESWFNEDYAQWSRIWINEGADVTINNAIITNAFVGVQIEPLPTNDGPIYVTDNIIKIENTIITNTKNSGVISRFLNLDMTNCLITNNGGCGLQLEGGQFTMKHLTVANYYMQADRSAPACYVTNKVALYNDLPMDVKANFINCIIYGRNETEIEVEKDQGANAELTLQNCLLRSKNNATYFIECLHNEDPQFTDRSKLDFTLLPESPAIGKGKPNIEVPFDILGNSRGDFPDIGAYQFGK
ncbi:MAG: right-handed parallel beta-helix repeat-containing protein [Bacteroidales bacterium]|jgi:hypothetical protein|nr:right-handed parallel beta-helix repeat-containing protein [Bacteroidales bacterium]